MDLRGAFLCHFACDLQAVFKSWDGCSSRSYCQGSWRLVGLKLECKFGVPDSGDRHSRMESDVVSRTPLCLLSSKEGGK